MEIVSHQYFNSFSIFDLSTIKDHLKTRGFMSIVKININLYDLYNKCQFIRGGHDNYRKKSSRRYFIIKGYRFNMIEIL